MNDKNILKTIKVYTDNDKSINTKVKIKDYTPVKWLNKSFKVGESYTIYLFIDTKKVLIDDILVENDDFYHLVVEKLLNYLLLKTKYEDIRFW